MQITWIITYIPRFVRKHEALRRILVNRISGMFDDIDSDANEYSEDWLQQSGFHGSGPDTDVGAMYDEAYEIYIDFGLIMQDLKYGFTHLIAIAAYHLFEQQLQWLLTAELIPPGSEDLQLNKAREQAEEIFRKSGIEVQSFESWNKINELRLVCNVAKHGHGRAADSLSELRPDYFEPGRSLEPMLGEGFKVPATEVETYIKAVELFWNELKEELWNLSDHGNRMNPPDNLP